MHTCIHMYKTHTHTHTHTHRFIENKNMLHRHTQMYAQKRFFESTNMNKFVHQSTACKLSFRHVIYKETGHLCTCSQFCLPVDPENVCTAHTLPGICLNCTAGLVGCGALSSVYSEGRTKDMVLTEAEFSVKAQNDSEMYAHTCAVPWFRVKMFAGHVKSVRMHILEIWCTR